MGTVPKFDLTVVRGNTLPMAVRYAPGGTPMDWTGATVEVSVRKKDGTEITVPSDRITTVAPGDLTSPTQPNLLTRLIPSEVATLDETFQSPYEIRVTDSNGDIKTVLIGVIVVVFSPVEGA